MIAVTNSFSVEHDIHLLERTWTCSSAGLPTGREEVWSMSDSDALLQGVSDSTAAPGGCVEPERQSPPLEFLIQ